MRRERMIFPEKSRRVGESEELVLVGGGYGSLDETVRIGGDGGNEAPLVEIAGGLKTIAEAFGGGATDGHGAIGIFCESRRGFGQDDQFEFTLCIEGSSPFLISVNVGAGECTKESREVVFLGWREIEILRASTGPS